MWPCFLKILTLAFLPIFLVIAAIIGLLVILPFLILRWSVSVLARLFKSSELRKMVTCMSSIMGAEEIYCESSFTITTSMEYSIPCPNVDRIRNYLEKTIKDVDSKGSIRYPELKECVKEWMGYLFWSPVHNFDIKKHVYLLEELNVPPPDWSDPYAMDKLGLYLTRKKLWVKDQPLWEFIIVPNVPAKFLGKFLDTDKDIGSIVVFRLHHLVGDGFCVFKFLTRSFKFVDTLETSLGKPKDIREMKSGLEVFLDNIKLAFFVPYDFVEDIFKYYFSNKETKIPKLGVEKGEGSNVNGLISGDIPNSRIKNVKTLHKVDFTSVILAMITAGTRRMILKHSKSDEISPDMEINVPLPMPGHPDKLRNHATVGSVMLPIGEKESVKRLRTIHERLVNLRESTLPWSWFVIITWAGSLPISIGRVVRKVSGDNGAQLIFSNLLGPSECIYFDGLPLLGIRVACNAPIDINPGYAFFLITYNGNARITVGALSNYLRTLEDAQELLGYCLEELDVLSRDELV